MNDSLKTETCFKYSINNGFVNRGKNERALTENLNLIRELPVESRTDLLFIFGSDLELFAVGNQNLFVVRKGRIEHFLTDEIHDLKKRGAGLSFKLKNNSYKVKLDSSEAADELFSSLSRLIGLKPVIRKQSEKRGNGMKTFLKWVGVICAVLAVGAVAYLAGIKVGSEDSMTADSGSSSVASSLTSSEQDNTSKVEQTEASNTQSSSLTKGTVEGISSVVDEMQSEFDEMVKAIRKDSRSTSGAENVSRHINNNLIDMEDYEKTGGNFYPEAVAYLEYLKETMDLFDQAYHQGDETYLNAGLDHWETSKEKRLEYETQLQKAQEEVGIKASTN